MSCWRVRATSSSSSLSCWTYTPITPRGAIRLGSGYSASSALEWEALSISYTAIIGFTALFFAICMGGPMLKVIFINHRERFRLREVAFMSLFLVLLSGVFTLTALQTVHFSMSDDVEQQLGSLGETLSNHIHDDLKHMREQLQEWCKAPELIADLRDAKDRE